MSARRSGCDDCGRTMWYIERVSLPQEFCFPCAARRGLTRLADVFRIQNLRRDASDLPIWWRWTVFLEHAIAWHLHDERTVDRADG